MRTTKFLHGLGIEYETSGPKPSTLSARLSLQPHEGNDKEIAKDLMLPRQQLNGEPRTWPQSAAERVCSQRDHVSQWRFLTTQEKKGDYTFTTYSWAEAEVVVLSALFSSVAKEARLTFV